MNIDQILEIAPAKICEYAEQENKSHAEMTRLHEGYKRERAMLYLQAKANKTGTIPEIESELDIDERLTLIKDAELKAEIDYRAYRVKKEKAKDMFMSACERGRNQRIEMKSLNNTIGG